jgi:hypothetical protein
VGCSNPTLIPDAVISQMSELGPGCVKTPSMI